MQPSPLKASVELVASVTGQDLSGLSRLEFIDRVQQLYEERVALETPPAANAKGGIRLTLDSLGDSWILAGVLSTERHLLLN